jgi:hypothetical protein
MPNIFVEMTGNGSYSKKIISKNKQKIIVEIVGNPTETQFEAKGK